MSGVRCPSCAAIGIEVWIIPGRQCTAEFHGEGEEELKAAAVLTNSAPWKYHGDLVFTTDKSFGGESPGAEKWIVAETWMASHDQHFISGHFNNQSAFAHAATTTKLL